MVEGQLPHFILLSDHDGEAIQSLSICSGPVVSEAHLVRKCPCTISPTAVMIGFFEVWQRLFKLPQAIECITHETCDIGALCFPNFKVWIDDAWARTRSVPGIARFHGEVEQCKWGPNVETAVRFPKIEIPLTPLVAVL